MLWGGDIARPEYLRWQLASESSQRDEVVWGGSWRECDSCPQILGPVKGQHGVAKMAVISISQRGELG